MTETPKKIIAIEIPVAEAADMTIKAAHAGVSLAYFAGILALQGGYGFMHPEVVAYRNRPKAGVCGPKTGSEE